MTQSHLIVTEEGLKIYKDDPSSAILCEDQERAMDLIHEIEYQKWRANGKYIIKIGSIYPVPGIEFQEVEVMDFEKDCLTGTFYNTMKVARLIENTAKKEDTDKMFKEWIGESPEIDKEEEQDSMWKKEYDDAVREICDLQSQLKEAESHIRTLEAELRER